MKHQSNYSKTFDYLAKDFDDHMDHCQLASDDVTIEDLHQLFKGWVIDKFARLGARVMRLEGEVRKTQAISRLAGGVK
jgi:hypothetical protein